MKLLAIKSRLFGDQYIYCLLGQITALCPLFMYRSDTHTYVAHIFKAAIMMGVVGQLALIPLVANKVASQVLAGVKGVIEGHCILFL